VKKLPVIAFGEIVWDEFVDKTVLGGAPLNVAYHLQAQNWNSGLISRVGNDRLGMETIEKIKRLGVEVSGIQKDDALPTGKVIITLDQNKEPSFDIVEPAAWDNIQESEIPEKLTNKSFHLVFGTLAQRYSVSRKSLSKFQQKARKKFYDVNLRPPFTSADQVKISLQMADVVKVNHQELGQLNDWFMQSNDDDHSIGLQMIDMFQIDLLAVTNGDKGATLINRESFSHHQGFPVEVTDPVGSGDAFFSALIIGYLSNLSLQECLIKANRLGSWVASQPGATPEYPQK